MNAPQWFPVYGRTADGMEPAEVGLISREHYDWMLLRIQSLEREVKTLRSAEA